MNILEEIIKLALRAYRKKNNYRVLVLILDKLELINLKEVKQKELIKQIKEIIVFAKELRINSNKRTINEFLMKIIGLSQFETKTFKQKILYNGTCLAVIFILLKGGFDFGNPNAFFFLNKKAAIYYASSNPSFAAKQIFEMIGLDYGKVTSKEDRKILEQPIVLEFENKNLDLKFCGIEITTGELEFSIKDKIPLSYLTERCKKEIIHRLKIQQGEQEYIRLYG
ncbi:hypothetical protein J4436_00805 [Candidatus Woesearchaeota archaeon]|nr:hypothetical protein [Candidatus Woesearchaeota archaeon]